jgi:hypothetical protein
LWLRNLAESKKQLTLASAAAGCLLASPHGLLSVILHAADCIMPFAGLSTSHMPASRL